MKPNIINCLVISSRSTRMSFFTNNLEHSGIYTQLTVSIARSILRTLANFGLKNILVKSSCLLVLLISFYKLFPTRHLIIYFSNFHYVNFIFYKIWIFIWHNSNFYFLLYIIHFFLLLI